MNQTRPVFNMIFHMEILIASGIVLRDDTFRIASDPQYDRYQCGMASIVYTFFRKKAGKTKTDLSESQVLTEELHKLSLENKRSVNVYSSYPDEIWCADPASMQLISKCKKQVRFLIHFIDIYSKYVWVVSLKDKKCITFTNASLKILDEPGRKANTIWVDSSSEFFNKSMN